MARININEKVLANIKNDDLVAMLNDIINTELAKTESKMDTDLVDACVDALLAIEQDENHSFVPLIPLMSSDKFLDKITSPKFNWKNLNTFARASIVAAVIAAGTITANAAVSAVTGVNVLQNLSDAVGDKLADWGIINKANIDVIEGVDEDDEEITTSATESTTAETTTIVETTTKVIETTTKRGVDVIEGVDDDDDTTTTKKGIDVIEGEDDDDDTTTSKPSQPTTNKPIEPTTAKPVKPTPTPDKDSEKTEVYLVGVYAEFDNFKSAYIYGEELSYDGLTLTKVYSDGTKTPLSLDECEYTKSVDMNKTQDVTLIITYQDCIIPIDISIRPDEDSRGSKICSNDEFDYLLTDKGVYITAYKGNSSVLSIEQIDGENVYAIGANAFKNSDVENVYAQDVVKIFDSAFENCKSLSECYVPSAEYIGKHAFAGCEALTEAVYSDDLYYLGNGAYRSTAITKITIPSSITEIPKSVCEDCSYLENVEFLGKVTKVDDLAFSNCTALETVTGTENIIEVGNFAFNEDSLVNFDTFPQDLTTVGENAFYFCQKLDIGALPTTVETVGEQAFGYCTKLTSIEIPSTMKKVPYGAFRATGAKSITIPEGVTEIDDYAFMSTKATKLYLPSTLKSIGEMAFYNPLLVDVYFGRNVASVGDNAFYAGRRVTFHVYKYTAPMTYAIEHSIKYEVLNPDEGFNIDVVDGEDD